MHISSKINSTLQMQIELERFDVQVRSVDLTSSYISSVSLIFEVGLFSSSPQQTGLNDFNNYFNSVRFGFGDFEVRDGNRGSIGITSASKHVNYTTKDNNNGTKIICNSFLLVQFKTA